VASGRELDPSDGWAGFTVADWVDQHTEHRGQTAADDAQAALIGVPCWVQIFGVFRTHGGRIAEQNLARSPVSGSVRRSFTRGGLTSTAPAAVSTSRGRCEPLRTTSRRPRSSHSPPNRAI
jgi:hypothetical protein